MRFHHHQLEKIQKHQRAHIRQLQKKMPSEKDWDVMSCHGMGWAMATVVNAMVEAQVETYRPELWGEEETEKLSGIVKSVGPADWEEIARNFPGRTGMQCMLHWRFALNDNATVRGSGTWLPGEDERLATLVKVFGQKWATVTEHMPGRVAKQCRERYLNHLDPTLRRDAWSKEEDEQLLFWHGELNNRFAKIAEHMSGRSYNDVKNRWSHISRQIAALEATASSSQAQSMMVTPTLSPAHVPTPSPMSASSSPLVRGSTGGLGHHTHTPHPHGHHHQQHQHAASNNAPYEVIMVDGVPKLRPVGAGMYQGSGAGLGGVMSPTSAPFPSSSGNAPVATVGFGGESPGLGGGGGGGGGGASVFAPPVFQDLSPWVQSSTSSKGSFWGRGGNVGDDATSV
ncbi:unnamed protein product [Discosporangium mesarthrocarpum]